MAAPRDRLRAAGGILSYFTRHATAANLVLVLFIAAGLAALPRMRAQYFPDVVIQEVTVTTEWEGAGAEDVDRGIVQLLEPALIAVEGVAEVSSVAREGSATVTLEFEPDWDLGRAVDEVEAAVAAVTGLPDDAERPEVRRSAWRDRVTNLVLTGPVAPDQLTRLADELLARLFEAGVTRASIEGLAAPEVVIEVPTLELMRHDLTLAGIAERVGAEAEADPAGELGGGAARLRTGTERRSPDTLRAIVLRSEPDGTALTLGDVARITVAGGNDVHAYYVGDAPAVVLRVDRSAEGDAIAIQRSVEAVAEAMRPSLPAGVTIDLIRVRSDDISARLDILLDNGAMGLALVVSLLFLFLNARTAFWVAAGIPVAMLAAVALMHASGLTLNMISLFALILTLGIVVDDAIVVGEHTDFRVRQLGEAPFTAAETAVRRMAAPVFSSTVTTVIAFLGLTAISGRFGDLIADIPFTISVVLIASLLEAFLILPNHMAHSLSKAARGHWYDAPSRVMNRGLAWVRERLFRPLTRAVIAARYPVLAAALALLAFEVGQFIRGDVYWRFFDRPERASITGNFAMLPGATREDSVEVMRALQESVETVAAKYRDEFGVEPLDYVIAEVGANSWPRLASAETKDPDHLGSISIDLVDPDLRSWSAFEFTADLQQAAPGHPMLEELSYRSWRHGPGGAALDVQLSGADADTLKAAAEALKRALAPFPEVSALEDSLPYDKDELVLELTPQGRALGFTVEALGRELRNRLSGIEAATFPAGTRTAKIRVELPERELSADFLDRTLLRSAAGAYVPLSDIVTVTARSGFSTIRREMGQRVVSVTGDLSEDSPERATEIADALETEILPRLAEDYGVAYRLSGLRAEEDTFLSDAFFGLIAALAGIYAVLAWIFSSWTRPLVVMAVIPFGLIGAIHGHAAWELPLSMFSVVGLIGMSGIIINDAIVLITTVDDYARRRAFAEAVVDAVADRLRPVMLTTATTVLGLAPLLYEGSRQAQFLKPTVITLCYGLGFGMFLVLLAVPALLAVQQDIAAMLRATRRAARNRALRPLMAGVALALLGAFGVLLAPALLGGEAVAPALGRFTLAAVAVTLAATGFGIWSLMRRRGRV
ncbi:efflux RND transporter permease subunit [Defluviimonas sp. WL0024]|uniref:Efflux RND transporter permease subunit n=1 Tax=Albidovulum salinarum TaxID=2984153 RepID=A0ABT2XA01_9RHOB|nr:efflux RND transporter permease subunit [Defluviimonas sp. WL0024]MCU9848590.1 efflux RND transporter permease subunit [Defluviimonas sp. WL0024]